MTDEASVAGWCTVSPLKGGAGRAEVMLTLTANESQAKREAKFVVEAAGDKVIFTVVQTTVDKSQMPEYDDKYEIPDDPDNPDDPGTEKPPVKPHKGREFERSAPVSLASVFDAHGIVYGQEYRSGIR